MTTSPDQPATDPKIMIPFTAEEMGCFIGAAEFFLKKFEKTTAFPATFDVDLARALVEKWDREIQAQLWKADWPDAFPFTERELMHMVFLVHLALGTVLTEGDAPRAMVHFTAAAVGRALDAVDGVSSLDRVENRLNDWLGELAQANGIVLSPAQSFERLLHGATTTPGSDAKA